MLQYRLLILFFFSFCAFSQIEVKEGPMTKKKLGAWHLGFIMADSSNVFALDDRNLGSPIISVFDKNSLEYQYDISLKLENSSTSNESLTHIFSLSNSIYCIIEEKTADKKILLHAMRVLNNGQHTEKIFLDTIRQSDMKGEYEIVVNEAEESFVFIKQSAFQNREPQNIQLNAFNQNLNLLWTKKVEFPDKSVQYVFSNWKYHGQNSLSFVARPILDLYKPDREFSNTDQNSYMLFNYDQTLNKVREIELSLNNRFINKIDFIQNDTCTIVSGIFSNDKNFNPDGVFSVFFDANFIRKNHSIHNFTESESRFFTTKQSYKLGRRSTTQLKKQNVDELLLRDMIQMENGEFVLLAEEFRKEWEDPIGGGKSDVLKPNTYVYYYQNILLFWFDRNGQLKKTSHVEKSQIARDAFNKYNSFVTAQSNNEIYLFFNENPNNLVLDASERKPTSSSKKMYVNCVKINAKGMKVTKQITEPSKRRRTLVNLGGQLMNNQVYFQKHKGLSKKAVIEIKLEE